jgi:hypothetical protein
MNLPPYIYGREAGPNEKVWTEAAVREAVAAAVPEGWKLVPIAPTPAMKEAGAYACTLGQDIAHHTYAQMIAAAPGGER